MGDLQPFDGGASAPPALDLPQHAAAWGIVSALWSAPVGIVLVDADLHVVAMNEALARMAAVERPPRGLPLATLLGRSPLSDTRELRRAIERREAMAECEVGGEVPGLRGTRRWLVSAAPIRGDGGPVAAVFASDVTEARRIEEWAERADAEAERSTQILLRLEAVSTGLAEAESPAEVARVILEAAVGLLDAAAGSVSRVDEGGELEVLDAVGYPERALVAWRRYAADLPAPLAEAYRTGEPICLESPAAFRARYPRLARAARPFEQGATVALPLPARGRILGVVGIDFAEPRAFDEADRAFMLALAGACAQALERAWAFEREAALRAEAQRTAAVLDTMLSSAPIGLAFVDRELRFLHVNAVFAAANLQPPTAFAGRRVEEVLAPPAGEQLAALWRDVLETGRPALEVEVERPGEAPGAPRTWLESWYPVMLGGSALGVGIVAREITAQKRAEAIRGHLLGIVGHDLRNPLSAVQGHASLLLRDRRLAPEQQRRLSAIVASVHRMDRMIGDLLDYTRANAGGFPLEPSEQRLDALLRVVVDEAEASAPGRVRLAGGGDPRLVCDPGRLEQAISNLVGNALRHGDPVAPVVVTWDGAAAHEVVVSVANRGAPIPPEVLARVFEPFRQGAAGARRHGLGLGLFIAREIARAHGGSIGATSTDAAGTVFTVRVPRRPANPVTRSAPSP
ncbi:sensor histidine kinase [Anaeromyxobacter oryzisoli]|uniref:sensor histidine kinase n=1 Tax=Anaeromyxobacter oryzisoli TaxID=2925408 RepID=UPI001F58EAC7|nr:PAS domain-containing protein [Anaeromyxobacter sp. SG63]